MKVSIGWLSWAGHFTLSKASKYSEIYCAPTHSPEIEQLGESQISSQYEMYLMKCYGALHVYATENGFNLKVIFKNNSV